jgi:integrase
MASVTKRPRSKFWVACFTDRNGRRLKRSTKITNRKEAQKKTDEYEQAWRQKKTALQFRRIMTEGYRSLTDGDVSHASVRAFFDSWTRHRDGYERWPFTVDQLRTVLSVADPEWKSMILCGLYTGQRLSDIALLTWENVDLERNKLRLVTRKTNKRLIIPLAPALARIFEMIPSSDDAAAPLHPRAHAIVTAQRKEGSPEQSICGLAGASWTEKENSAAADV